MTADIPVAVFDTNVLVSGLLSPFGKPGVVVDLFLSGRVRLAYDDRLLVEYREVIGRAEFGFTRIQIERLFSVFPFQERVLPIPWPHQPSPDPTDTMFLEVASAASNILVTGNIRHFPAECRGDVKVFTPAEWLEAHARFMR